MKFFEYFDFCSGARVWVQQAGCGMEILARETVYVMPHSEPSDAAGGESV